MPKSYIKELFSHTAVYGVGIFLNRAVAFFLIPLYTRYFSPADLGLFNLIQSVWFVICIFYLLGMETSFLKFFIDAGNEKEKSTVFSTTLFSVGLTSVIFSLIIYFLSYDIAELINFDDKTKAAFLIKILSLLLFFDAIYRFPMLLMRAELKPKLYLIISVVSLVVNLFFNFYFIIILKYNVEAIFYSYMLSVSFSLLVGLILSRKFISLRLSLRNALRYIAFGNKFIYIGFFILVIDLSDRFFLKYFTDEAIVGIYSSNYKLASIMGLAVASFKFSWTPYFLNLSKNPENKKIISDIFIYLIFTGLLLFLFFAFFIEPAVKINFFGINFLNENFWSGLSVVPIILLSYLFSGLCSTLDIAPFYTNKTYILLLIYAEGFIINIIFNFLLIPAYGMNGAALATLFTYLFLFFHIFIVSQKIYKIDYNWRNIAVLGLSAALLYLVSIIIKYYVIGGRWVHLICYLLLILIYIYVNNYLKVIKLGRLKTLFSRGG